MEPIGGEEVTRLLADWRRGDKAAFEALAPRIDHELRRLAAGYMRRERQTHTLQPTALVNEAWIRMMGQDQPNYENRAHFIAIAAQYMRQILVDHARRRLADKRGGGAALEPIEIADAIGLPDRAPELLALDDGLKALARISGRQVSVVELHYFGGLTYEEVADALAIGRATVIRDLKLAQLWLKAYLAP
jgi:RNA polymerase sigma factor (TIGR02999 family)